MSNVQRTSTSPESPFSFNPNESLASIKDRLARIVNRELVRMDNSERSELSHQQNSILQQLGKTEDWVWASQFSVELVAGIIMSAIVALLIMFRLPELKQVLSVHRRIKFYFGLTTIAIFVDLAIGIGGVLYLVSGKNGMYIAVTWTMRHIHIALDTLVLYSALGEARFDMETTQPSVGSSNEQLHGVENGRHGIPKRLAAAATSSRRREGGVSIQHSYATGTV